jgi:two-component system LytT family response regulator
MDPIRAMIVDDEPLARSDLCRMLEPHIEIRIVDQCGSGSEALAAIRRHAPDLVFLDVQMPELDGFDVLEQLGRQAPSAVVFVTAYDKYALRAFEAGALDYLMKPFDDARFERTLARAIERIEIGRAAPSRMERIVIKNGKEVTFVRVRDIDWIESADFYACIHVDSSTHVLRRSLSELEADLSSAGFVRIHRSTIVNMSRVQRLVTNDGGEYEIELGDRTRLKLSRRYRQKVLEALGVAKI